MFSESLEGYSEVMNKGAERLLQRLARAAAKGQEIDVWRYLGGLTMDVVGTASFGCMLCPPASACGCSSRPALTCALRCLFCPAYFHASSASMGQGVRIRQDF